MNIGYRRIIAIFKYGVYISFASELKLDKNNKYAAEINRLKEKWNNYSPTPIEQIESKFLFALMFDKLLIEDIADRIYPPIKVSPRLFVLCPKCGSEHQYKVPKIKGRKIKLNEARTQKIRLVCRYENKKYYLSEAMNAKITEIPFHDKRWNIIGNLKSRQLKSLLKKDLVVIDERGYISANIKGMGDIISQPYTQYNCYAQSIDIIFKLIKKHKEIQRLIEHLAIHRSGYPHTDDIQKFYISVIEFIGTLEPKDILAAQQEPNTKLFYNECKYMRKDIFKSYFSAYKQFK